MKYMLISGPVYLAFALPLSFMDSKKFRISLPLLFTGMVALIGSRFLFPTMPFVPLLKNLLFAAASSFLIYFSTRVLSGEGLGFGDILFGVYTSIFCGFYLNIVASVFAASLGLSVVLFYLIA